MIEIDRPEERFKRVGENGILITAASNFFAFTDKKVLAEVYRAGDVSERTCIYYSRTERR